jgi:4-diphosphocytidyl-2-C-methyl-D-erythritol kinase
MLKNAISLQPMILFAPAKINIGLLVIRRREDGYHDIQSVMHPVALYDLIEIMESGDPSGGITYTHSGIPVGSPDKHNLCIRAYELMSERTILPPVRLHLHKQIPAGAGLGGGSSDATTTLKGLNGLSAKPLSDKKLPELAGSLGSDCPFFFYGRTMMMEGRGEILSPVEVALDHLSLVLLHPGIHIATAEAYQAVKPVMPGTHLRYLISEPVEAWRELIVNDFETPVFEKYPELKELKKGLYRAGALYASLSGSGSALYGFFREPPSLPEALERIVIWKGGAGSAFNAS